MVKFKSIPKIAAVMAGVVLFITSGMALPLTHAWADPGVAPMNPAFIEWQNRQNDSLSAQSSRKVIIKDQARVLGLIPSPLGDDVFHHAD